MLSVFICRWAALRSRLRVKPTQDTDHLISSRVKALGTLREVRALTSQRGVCTYKSERCVHLHVEGVPVTGKYNASLDAHHVTGALTEESS